MTFVRRPMGQKPPKPTTRPDYLDAVRQLPCVVCQNHGEPQTSPTTAHHVICGRFGQRKTPDEMAIPLCDGHHQGGWDVGKIAIHKDRAAWVAAYGEDHEYTAQTQDRLAHLLR